MSLKLLVEIRPQMAYQASDWDESRVVLYMEHMFLVILTSKSH